jgi:hypothetical protein
MTQLARVGIDVPQRPDTVLHRVTPLHRPPQEEHPHDRRLCSRTRHHRQALIVRRGPRLCPHRALDHQRATVAAIPSAGPAPRPDYTSAAGVRTANIHAVLPSVADHPAVARLGLSGVASVPGRDPRRDRRVRARPDLRTHPRRFSRAPAHAGAHGQKPKLTPRQAKIAQPCTTNSTSMGATCIPCSRSSTSSP